MRLIDLRCTWLWQYATETTLFDPALYSDVPERVGRLNGYLQGTSAAVLFCGRKAREWECQGDRWHALAELLAASEAEFPGRLLIGPDDVSRWLAEPVDGLCWGMLAVAGFDYLVREPADLDRLPGLFERGVRVFQLVDGGSNVLAGSAEPGDDRGLTDLGRALLSRVGELGNGIEPGPRPIVDLAGLNARSMTEILNWVESQSAFAGRPLLIFSHWGVSQPGFETPDAPRHEILARLRALGGVVGLTPGLPAHQTADELKASIEAIASVPFDGRPGFEGIAISTDFVGTAQSLEGLAEVAHIKKWLVRTFDRETAAMLIAGNALRLLRRAAGMPPDAEPNC